MKHRNSGGIDRLHPGQSAPFSGQYAEVGPLGLQTTREVTAVKGKRMPPTLAPGISYVLVDPTNNGSGRKR